MNNACQDLEFSLGIHDSSISLVTYENMICQVEGLSMEVM